jgi:hypothetical protein
MQELQPRYETDSDADQERRDRERELEVIAAGLIEILGEDEASDTVKAMVDHLLIRITTDDPDYGLDLMQRLAASGSYGATYAAALNLPLATRLRPNGGLGLWSEMLDDADSTRSRVAAEVATGVMDGQFSDLSPEALAPLRTKLETRGILYDEK